MRRYRLSPMIAALSLVLSSGVLAPADGQQPGVGPHDYIERELDVRGYWLPRHRALLAARGVLRQPVLNAATDLRDAGRTKFRKPVRVSDDLLGPPAPGVGAAQAETQTEPYLAINPEDPNHLVAGWQEHRFADGGARALGYAVSTNGGKKWTEGRVPGLTEIDGGPWPRASDPWPAFGPGGRVYYASLLFSPTNATNAIGVSVSEDGGLTWGDPVEVLRSNADFHDKEAVVVDTFAASPHFGNVYVGWDINVAGGGRFVSQRLVVSRSTNGGRRWRAPVTLNDGFTNIGIVPRVGPDGTVHAVWAGASAQNPNLAVYFSRSTNGGKQWSTARKLADLLTAGVAGFRSGGILPSFAVDPNSGDLFAAWPDARFTGVDQVAMIVSRDGGATWSSPTRVSDGPATSPAFTVSIATNDVGHVAVSYYTLRNDPNQATSVDHYVNVSTDLGASFESGSRVTRKSFDATAAARAGGSSSIFLGDYEGLVGGGRHFYSLWVGTDRRSKLGPGRQPDVFAARTR